MASLIEKLECLTLDILYEAGDRGDDETARLLKATADLLTTLVAALRKIA